MINQIQFETDIFLKFLHIWRISVLRLFAASACSLNIVQPTEVYLFIRCGLMSAFPLLFFILDFRINSQININAGLRNLYKEQRKRLAEVWWKHKYAGGG